MEGKVAAEGSEGVPGSNPRKRPRGESPPFTPLADRVFRRPRHSFSSPPPSPSSARFPNTDPPRPTSAAAMPSVAAELANGVPAAGDPPGPEEQDHEFVDLDADTTAAHHLPTLGLQALGKGGLVPHSCTFVRTKIVCTLGPASRSVAVLERLLKAGMNVARFNFSHGSHEYHQETLDNLRQACTNTRILCATLLDTKGPEIRTGFLKDGKAVKLEKGKEVVLTTDYSVKGDASLIAMSYKSLPLHVKPGMTILCADGSISLLVLECRPQDGTVRCLCENSATLGERKNVNLPGVEVDLPTVTEKDVDDILHWGVKNNVDFIAASFVRKGSDVLAIRKLLGPEQAQKIHIISKVENQEGLINFDSILKESDGIMVARGDLGMEIPTEKVFLAQKLMIYKCNATGKPVITATQMLESMTKSPRPTRAEATDVANAVLDGTDAVMLSGETAAGAYPEEAVRVMARICREAEASLDYHKLFKKALDNAPLPMSPLESLSSTAVRTAISVRASLLIILTFTGATARLVAKYRPPMPILSVAVPTLEGTKDRLEMVWSGPGPALHGLVSRGLVPILGEGTMQDTDTDTTEEILHQALAYARDVRGLCKDGDSVVVLHRLANVWVIKVDTVHSERRTMGRVPSDYQLKGLKGL